MDTTMNETHFTRKEAQVLDLHERNPGAGCYQKVSA
jgi:hypothetical protein